MRTAATPWDALLCQPLPIPQPADACTVLVVDGRRVTDPDQLRRHFGDSDDDSECQQKLLERARQIAAARAATPEQRKARRRKYMRAYLQDWRARKRQAAAAVPPDPETPTPERTDR